eukprot:Pompholyxophrys_punicea_v1_NODE_1435_length_721_cov_2.142643.p2 type:complete len:104 gc:universal NODE_1435_length_721_cov_2.142643:234-545(+)
MPRHSGHSGSFWMCRLTRRLWSAPRPGSSTRSSSSSGRMRDSSRRTTLRCQWTARTCARSLAASTRRSSSGRRGLSLPRASTSTMMIRCVWSSSYSISKGIFH